MVIHGVLFLAVSRAATLIFDICYAHGLLRATAVRGWEVLLEELASRPERGLEEPIASLALLRGGHAAEAMRDQGKSALLYRLLLLAQIERYRFHTVRSASEDQLVHQGSRLVMNTAVARY